MKLDDEIFVPPTDDPEVVELYEILKSFVKTGKVNFVPKYIKYIKPDAVSHSREKVYEIVQRLKNIRRFKIRDKEIIVNLFIDIFKERRKITIHDLEILKEIVRNPLIRYVDIAKKFKMSRPTAKKRFDFLAKTFKIRFASFLNPYPTKLRRFFLHFIVDVDEARILKDYLDSPFTMNINLDVFTEVGGVISGWSFFYLPNSQNFINRFKSFLVKLFSEGILRDYTLYEQTAIGYDVNLDLFDGTTWHFDAFQPAFTFSHVKENYDLYPLPDFQYFKRIEKPIKFTQADLLILFNLMNNVRLSLKDLQSVCKSYGTILSLQEISRKRNFFLKELLKPYARLNNLGLTTALILIVSFDENISEYKDILSRYISNFMPLHFTTLTETGVISFIELPPESLDRVAYRMKLTLKTITDEVHIITRYYSLGSKGLLDLVPLWNEKFQRWDIPKNLFDASKI